MRRADVVVIGAGISGLMAAAFLARDGREVVLLEQGAGPGGCVGGFVRQGYYFDGGAQSFESLGLVFPLLKQLGRLDGLQVERTDYRLRTPTVDCSLSSYEAVEEAFCRAHPRARKDLRAFFRQVFQVSRGVESLAQTNRTPFLYRRLERVRALARIGLSNPRAVLALHKAHQEYQRDVAARCLHDPGLAGLLGSFGYRDASLFALGAFFACWRQDYWRPRHGMQRLPETLAECCASYGAKLSYGASVQEILREHDQVIGVRLADGEEIRSSVVVAACDHTHLERDLLGRVYRTPAPADVSDAFFTLFLGLEMDEAALDQLLPEHHTFLVPAHRDCRLDPDDPRAHRGRWVEVSRSSARGTDQAPAGCASLTVQTMTRVDWADWWGRGRRGERSERYRARKEQVEEELLDTVEQFVPALRSRIRLRFSATPWTYQRYTRNLHGASAGWSWDPGRAKVRETLGVELNPSERREANIRGLYRCGHWTASPGSVPGAALSGWEAFEAVKRDGR